jgi:hypothetical protein
MVFVNYYVVFVPAIHLEISRLENINKIMVSRNLRQAHLLEVFSWYLTKILRYHEILSIVRLVGLHVDFSFMKSSLDF